MLFLQLRGQVSRMALFAQPQLCLSSHSTFPSRTAFVRPASSRTTDLALALSPRYTAATDVRCRHLEARSRLTSHEQLQQFGDFFFRAVDCSYTLGRSTGVSVRAPVLS